MTILITYILIFSMVLIYLSPINFYDTKSDIINYGIRPFYHADSSHLIANMISFYGLSSMENILGSSQYLFAIVFIWFFSSLFLYVYHLIFKSQKVYTVGFSGVIFGLIVVYYTLMGKTTTETTYSLLLSIIPQLFMTGISSEGHACGILAGLLYVKVRNLFFLKIS